MEYTQEQIDEISVTATNMIKAQFDDFEDDHPPEVTPGMAWCVLTAAEQLSKINRLEETPWGGDYQNP